VHFLDAWTQLAPADLARYFALPFFIAMLIVLPGRRPSAAGCMGLALSSLASPDPTPLVARIAWALLWLALAIAIVRWTPDPPPDPGFRRGGVESGAVGLLLALALLLLLVAAVARQNLPEALSRESSYALFVIVLGLLHLMLRRHVLRASIAMGAMGMGLDRLVRLADTEQLPGAAASSLGVWLATAFAVALVVRIARLRSLAGGGAWVSGAHDLHD
jgi:hypothetical protein